MSNGNRLADDATPLAVDVSSSGTVTPVAVEPHEILSIAHSDSDAGYVKNGGDMLFYDAVAGLWTGLPIGSTSPRQFVKVNAAGSEPEWGDIQLNEIPQHELLGDQHASVDATNFPTRGALIVGMNFAGTNLWSRLPLGANKTYLGSDGSDADWRTDPVVQSGRAGGQTVPGGTAAADELTIKSSVAAGATGRVLMDMTGDGGQFVTPQFKTSNTARQTAYRVANGQTITFTAAGGYGGFVIDGTWNSNSNAAGGVFGLVFNNAPTINLADVATPTAGSKVGMFRVYQNGPVINFFNGATARNYGTISGDNRIVNDAAQFLNPAANASTARVTSWNTVDQGLTIGQGYTFDVLGGMRVRVPAGTGKVGNVATDEWYGVRVDDLGTFAGTTTARKSSMLSFGDTVPLRHQGQGVFGALVPTNAACILEVQSTVGAFVLPRMTTAQRDAMGANIIDGMVIYNTTTTQKETRQAGAWVAT